MTENQNQKPTINQLVEEALAQNQPADWFEKLYAQAAGNPEEVPWAKLQPNPHLLEWIEKFTVTEANKQALVIGCGLGDDAEAISAPGFDVTAFDISSTAIAWCQRRFPDSNVKYLVADLFNLDSQWRQKFDLVLSSRTVQSLPIYVRPQVISLICDLVGPGGILLVITQVRPTETPPPGPPWPLSTAELDLFSSYGLSLTENYSYDNSTHLLTWTRKS